MSKRSPIKTTIKEAIDHWRPLVDECDLSVDWSEADTHCWRCGCEKDLQRCHIIPDSLGGKDEPANIVLLCSRCYAEGPNVTDPEVMWDWIKAYNVPLYETFWTLRGLKEYEFIYHKSVNTEIQDILEKAGIPKDTDQIGELIEKHSRELYKEASIHFAQPYFNTATVAGLYRIMLKRLAKSLGVSFPIQRDDENSNPWWLMK